MDVHRAARISQKLLLTPHGHHVQTLVVAVVVVVVVVKRSRRKPQKVAVEEEGVDVDVVAAAALVGLMRALLVYCLCLKKWRGE